VGRLGSTAARLKLKGIDGEMHNQGSMWFNSIQSVEPYLGLTCICNLDESRDVFESNTQLLHGYEDGRFGGNIKGKIGS